MIKHFARHRISLVLGAIIAAMDVAAGAQTDEKFAIDHFEIKGATLFSPIDLERMTAPFTGRDRVFGDVQRALEAVESAYRGAGFSAVQVLVPEQELTQGVVRIQVIET